MSLTSALGGITSVAGKVGSIAGVAGGIANNITALIGESVSNTEIRERYLSGFLGNTTQHTPNVFSRLFDEPTYLTFRLDFDFRKDLTQNSFDTLNNLSVDSLNYMPEPFLAVPDISTNGELETLNKNYYSTYTYLKDALGEYKRADMLLHFVQALKDIQNNYPYYFTEVVGLDTLLQVNTERGIRILDGDNNKLTISCIEGLDQKITQILQMYRKIVWDDVYQRWILPDMMRYFTLRIYISEMRLFHTYPDRKMFNGRSAKAKRPGFLYDFKNNPDAMNYRSTSDMAGTSFESVLGIINNVTSGLGAMSSNLLGDSAIGNAITGSLDAVSAIGNSLDSIQNAINGNLYLCENAINEVMPTICIECHMCEFDIASTAGHLSGVGASMRNVTPPEPQIVIKVGNIKEKMLFPLEKRLTTITDESEEKKYHISADLAASKYIDDTILQKEATYRHHKIEDAKPLGSNDQHNISSKRARINEHYGGGTIDTTGSNKPEQPEAYDPFAPDKTQAASNLFNTAISATMSWINKDTDEETSLFSNSSATEGQKAKEARKTLTAETLYNNVELTKQTPYIEKFGAMKDEEAESLMYKIGADGKPVYIGFSEAIANKTEDASTTFADDDRLITIIDEDAKSLMYKTDANGKPVYIGYSEAIANKTEDASTTFADDDRMITINNTSSVDSSYTEIAFVDKDMNDPTKGKVWKGYSSAQQSTTLQALIEKMTQEVPTGYSEANENNPETVSSGIDDASFSAATNAENTSNISTGISDASFSAATTSSTKISKIIDENGYEKVFSAATALKSTIEFFIENEQVKSVATSDEERKKLIDSLTASALEKIATSTATDPNSKVLQELASAIIDDVEVSAATSEEYSYKVSKTPYVSDPGFSQATTNKSAFNSTAFNFLNN